MPDDASITYGIWDPTGNITALVESMVPSEEQPALARRVMARHHEVEQVGFITRLDDAAGAPQARLRMAGGEFCGNASMCAAAWYVRRNIPDSHEQVVMLEVSGAQLPIEVRLKSAGEGYEACIHMPRSCGFERVNLTWDGHVVPADLVRMEGISHLVIRPASGLYALLQDRASAELAIRAWCRTLDVDGLGAMFFSGAGMRARLDPLVFVPEAGTTFWESSCASGSTACGMLLAHESGSPVELELHEPGGILRVSSDEHGDAWLSGHVRLVASHVMS